ncbi:MAG: hypothetical protein QF733_09775 [Phycisphaerales bacterium]|jgi:hypothetical protein|nr:hypothetical protein [Phycisphaerales bacterium]
MRQIRHDFATRCILLLLAAAMPLCCCVVRNMGAALQPGESTITLSCCATQQSCDRGTQSEPQDQSSECDECRCIKAPATAANWAPPVDVIGEAAFECAVVLRSDADAEAAIGTHPDRPPPGPWSCSAPPLRHATILQV